MRSTLAHYQRLAAGCGGKAADPLTEERVKLTRAMRSAQYRKPALGPLGDSLEDFA
jgi:hypothetical protein